MGLLDHIVRSADKHIQSSNRNRNRNDYEQGGKLYRIISTISILGLFLAVGLLVLGIMQGFMSAGLCLFLAIIAIICLTCTLALYWVRFIEKKLHVTVSIVMLALLGLATIIWIIIAIIIYSMYVQGKNGTLGEPRARMTFIQIGLILTFQIFEALLITSTIIRYKKNYLVFQIIMYVSNLFVDFWFSVLFSLFNFNGTGSQVFNLDGAKFLTTKGMITALVLFIVYTMLCNQILKTIETRRARNLSRDIYSGDDQIVAATASNEAASQIGAQPAAQTENAEEILAKLKTMFEKNLITEEEYNKKRAEIIDKM